MQNLDFQRKGGENAGPGPAAELSTLRLDNFRNFDEEAVQLATGLNVLSGDNAQGKTGLLEAAYLLGTTRILRPGRDTDAVQHGAEKAVVSGELAHIHAQIAVHLVPGGRKTAFLNGSKLLRASDLLGRLPCVCVSALDLELIRGEPSERRMFLDLELSQLFPAYLQHLAHYRRSLEHRASLLRSAQEAYVSDEEFEVWEQRLAQHGVALREYRMRFIEAIGPYTTRTHGQMGSGEEFSIEYLPKDLGSSAEELMQLYGLRRKEEIARGSNLIGPHRDDLSLFVAGKESRAFGSQGQQRTAVTALKLATLEYASSLGPKPLLLLDDMLSDLDEGRRGRLVEWVIQMAGQAILTCTEPEAAGKELLSRAKVFEVKNGRVSVQ